MDLSTDQFLYPVFSTFRGIFFARRISKIAMMLGQGTGHFYKETQISAVSETREIPLEKRSLLEENL
jgi:hypothetical protein